MLLARAAQRHGWKPVVFYVTQNEKPGNKLKKTKEDAKEVLNKARARENAFAIWAKNGPDPSFTL